MADLAAWLIQQTAISLLLQPFDLEDQELLDEDIPAPMYSGWYKMLIIKQVLYC